MQWRSPRGTTPQQPGAGLVREPAPSVQSAVAPWPLRVGSLQPALSRRIPQWEEPARFLPASTHF